MSLQYVRDPEIARQICAELRSQKIIGIDIETHPLASFEEDPRAGLDPHRSQIRLVTVATCGGQHVVFDMHRLSPRDLDELGDTPWSAHNAGFEYRHMTHAGFRLPAKLHDTMLMGRPIHDGNLSLSDLSKIELDIDLDKTLQRSDWRGELSREQLSYAAADAAAAVDLTYQLLPKLDREGLRPVYELYRRVVPIIGDQSLRGLAFNWERHAALCEEWADERDTRQLELRQLLGDINYRSGKQLANWLTANLPVDVINKWPRTAIGVLQTSADVLTRHAHLPLVQPLLRFKAAEKLLGTYGVGYRKHQHPVTGRLHPDILIAGTAGGRFACRNPNVQNAPRLQAFRALFAAPAGRVLVAADFSQMELRVAALLANEGRMLEAYARGDDLHRITAAAVAGVAPSEVTATQRQAAKAINFGNLYRQRPGGLVRVARSSYGVEMTVAEAAHSQHQFFTTFPDLYRWQMHQIKTARVYGKVQTRMGLVRRFDGSGGYLEAEACNHPIQGSANEVLLAALALLPECLKGCDAFLYNHIHDEIVLDVAEDAVEAAVTGLEFAMRSAFLQIFPEAEAVCTGLVEVKSGCNWAAAK
jgi:DNA polymerase-1